MNAPIVEPVVSVHLAPYSWILCARVSSSSRHYSESYRESGRERSRSRDRGVAVVERSSGAERGSERSSGAGGGGGADRSGGGGGGGGGGGASVSEHYREER